jgi:plastocyanin
MRPSHRLAAVALLLTAGCGGSSSPTSPTSSGGGSTGGGTSGAVTISISATAGANSFTPNPATQNTTGAVMFRNADGVVHRIVANDGSFDSGDIAPGATSRSLPAPAAGTNYHCSLHPAMIGAIGGQQGEAPPACTGLYCEG